MNNLSWDWLADISSRLDVAIELIDAEARPLLPAGTTREAARFRRAIAGEPSVRAAMAEALRSHRRVPVAFDGLRALCCGLEPGGLLLLASAVDDSSTVETRPIDLDIIASWLIGAVIPSLVQPAAVNVEAYRLVSFRRILREATARGVIREVVGSFAEALSVWDDVRVHCYIAGARGGFLHYASALSALPTSAPGRIDESHVPRRVVAPLARADAARIGLTPEPGDTAIARFAVGEVDWLLLFSGVIDDREQVRLGVYCDMLRESLTETVSAATNRLVADVSHPAGAPSERPASAAHRALASLTDAIGSREGAIAVALPDDRPDFVVGDKGLLASANRPESSDLIVSSSEAGSTLTVVIARDQPPFNALERHLVQAAAAAVHRSMLAGLPPSAHADRRRHARPLDVVFDEIAGQSVTLGRPASVIVVGVLDPGGSHDVLPDWVRRIRRQLRAGDFAGLLNDREIAVLLCGASADHATAVSARLSRMFAPDDETSLRTTIGVTTRTPQSPADGSIVAAARASAAAH